MKSEWHCSICGRRFPPPLSGRSVCLGCMTRERSSERVIEAVREAASRRRVVRLDRRTGLDRRRGSDRRRGVDRRGFTVERRTGPDIRKVRDSRTHLPERRMLDGRRIGPQDRRLLADRRISVA